MNFKEEVKAIVEGSGGIKKSKRKSYAILKKHGYDSKEYKAAQARVDHKDVEGRQRELDKSNSEDSWTSDSMRWLQNVGKKVKARRALPKHKARARVKAKNLKKSKPKDTSLPQPGQEAPQPGREPVDTPASEARVEAARKKLRTPIKKESKKSLGEIAGVDVVKRADAARVQANREDPDIFTIGRRLIKKLSAKKKSQSKSQKESSNHPFYQKVKALSSNKKSQSILEKKSKTIRMVIAKIKPCRESKEYAEAYRKWLIDKAEGRDTPAPVPPAQPAKPAPKNLKRGPRKPTQRTRYRPDRGQGAEKP